MEYKIINDIKNLSVSEWDNFINNQPLGTVFQSHDMYQLFERTKKFEPILIVVLKNQKIAGILLAVIIKEYQGPLGIISARTVVYGGPVVDNKIIDSDDVLDLILKNLVKKVKNKSIFIQFRNFHDWKDKKKIFINNKFHFFDRLNFLVQTNDKAQTFKKISSSKRRQINVALKNGAVIKSPDNYEEMRAFYEILHKLYKNKVKKPLPDWSFFKSFYELSLEGRLGVIKVIKFENKIIGGILSPISKGKSIFEWYICGLDSDYKNLYPSVLSTFAPIDYALKNGISQFDFMGVGVPDKDYGVRDFKSKFGGEMVNYGRFGRINNRFIYAITEVGFNILALLRKI